MPAAVEEYADGSHGFVSARVPAWHRLGVVFEADALTAEQALSLAKLDGWNVRKMPVLAYIDETTQIEVEGKFAVVRDNPVTGQVEANGGVVGNQWTPVQNEETCAFLQAIVDESGAVFQTAGSLNDGADVFVTMKMPESMMVGGRDEVDCYISAFNNHDGTAAFRATVSPVRVVCANTQRANISAAKSMFKIRHTTNAAKAIEAAREALGLTWKYLEGFQAEADAMLAAAMSDAEFDAFLADELCGDRPVLGEKTESGSKVTARMIEAHDAEVGSLRHLFRDADTQADIRNTRWAAYQSVVEYMDWAVPVASKKVDASQYRALQTVTSLDTNRFKSEVFDLLKVG
jgi:phage/plasmid-like protein (TIGR03299 family)